MTLITTKKYRDIANILKPIGDIERIIARIALLSARPRDLEKLKISLLEVPNLHQVLAATPAKLCGKIQSKLHALPELANEIDNAIINNPPQLIRDGGVIKYGYSEQLDRLRSFAAESNQYLKDLEQREKTATGIDF